MERENVLTFLQDHFSSCGVKASILEALDPFAMPSDALHGLGNSLFNGCEISCDSVAVHLGAWLGKITARTALRRDGGDLVITARVTGETSGSLTVLVVCEGSFSSGEQPRGRARTTYAPYRPPEVRRPDHDASPAVSGWSASISLAGVVEILTFKEVAGHGVEGRPQVARGRGAGE